MLKTLFLPGASGSASFWKPLATHAQLDGKFFAWPGLGDEPPQPGIESIDDLIDRTGQLAQDIAVRLMLLELEGLVETLPGGQYSRVPHPANRKVN